MEEKIGINIIIEEEDGIFIASSPDINVFVEGDTIEEAKKKFISGVNHYFESFPEEEKLFFSKEKGIIENEKTRAPMIQRIFL